LAGAQAALGRDDALEMRAGGLLAGVEQSLEGFDVGGRLTHDGNASGRGVIAGFSGWRDSGRSSGGVVEPAKVHAVADLAGQVDPARVEEVRRHRDRIAGVELDRRRLGLLL